MSVYVVTGKLGAGKSLIAVSRIRTYLREGRRVATNLDLRVEHLLPTNMQRIDCLRVPDKPTAADLDAIGLGADVLDESRYGLLVLDELGSWLNARDWGDKQRGAMIDWLIHSRKRRWDVILIVQNVGMIDKQIREALLEYLVTCKRLDRIRIPFFGIIGQVLTLGAWNGRVGRVHLGVVVYAAGAALLSNALVTDRWLYRGTELFKAYDTEQVFSSRYGHGIYSYRSPFDLVGRWLPRKVPVWERLVLWSADIGVAKRPTLGPKHPLVEALCFLRDPDERLRHWHRLERLRAFHHRGEQSWSGLSAS